MNRRQVYWCPAPDDEEDVTEHSIHFRLVDDWLAVDGREIVLPINLLERDGEAVSEAMQAGILKQFGGESILNDMLLSDYEVEAGSHWILTRTADRTTIDGVPSDD